jgi:hypothetical protein
MIPGDASLIGRYFNVELTGTTGSTFLGRIVGQRGALPMARLDPVPGGELQQNGREAPVA